MAGASLAIAVFLVLGSIFAFTARCSFAVGFSDIIEKGHGKTEYRLTNPT
jgi:hypothetical protein